jgi:hypothetical protein
MTQLDSTVFIYNDEALSLSEIIKTKTIISVTFQYYTKETIKISGWKRIFRKVKILSEEKYLTITDHGGITFDKVDPAIIRFWKKSEYDKITNFDPDTMIKSYMMSFRPYRITFPIENLKNLTWE